MFMPNRAKKKTIGGGSVDGLKQVGYIIVVKKIIIHSRLVLYMPAVKAVRIPITYSVLFWADSEGYF